MSAKKAMALAAYSGIAGLLVLISYPALVWLVLSWRSNPYYSHGFLVPIIAAVLLWRQWHQAATQPHQGGAWAGLLITAFGLATLLWSLRWQDYAVACMAMVGLAIGILLYLEGWPRLKPLLFSLLFLTLMVPLPIVDRASPWFEAFTAKSAAALARLFGIAAVQQGGEITLPNTTVTVGAPCSGLRSLVAMLTVGVCWVYLIEGRIAAKVVMLAAILPLVALGNVLRIGLLLVVAQRFGQQIALSYYHDWSSPILFLVSLGLFLLLGKVLGCSEVRSDIW